MYKWCSDRFSTLRENPSEEDDYDNYYKTIYKQGMSFNYLQSYVKMPVSAWCYIPTSLPPEPSSILYYLKLNYTTKGPVVSIG